MNYEENKTSAIIDYLKGLELNELISLYNEYAGDVGNDLIYDNDEYILNELFNNNVMSGIRAACFGDYNYNDDYVTFDGYGNLESLHKYNVDDHIDFDDFADWIIQHTPQEVIEELEEILPDTFKSLLESDNVSVDDEDIIDSVIADHDIIDDDWDELADEVKKEIENYYKEKEH